MELILPTRNPSCERARDRLLVWLKRRLNGFSWTATPTGHGTILGWWRDPRDNRVYEDRSSLLFADIDDAMPAEELENLLRLTISTVQRFYRDAGAAQVAVYIAIQMERKAVIASSAGAIPIGFIPP